jgi:hypothetical protein
VIYSAGVFFLIAATLLFGVFNRTFFFGDGHMVGPLDFSEVFYWAQWSGFWFAALSAVLFALAARQSSFPWFSRRAIAPALALVLCVHFVMASIPEWSNRDGWRKGALGWNVYMETKRRLWREKRADAELKHAFAGQWKNAQGVRVEIKPGRIRFTGPACAEYSTFRYEMAEWRELGIHFYHAGLAASPLYRNLPDRRYPLLTCVCNGREAAFMVLEPRRLFAVLEDGSSMTFVQ